MRRELHDAMERERKLSMAFERWQYEAEKLANERRMVKWAIIRMRERQLSKAFNQWWAEAAQLMATKVTTGSRQRESTIYDR